MFIGEFRTNPRASTCHTSLIDISQIPGLLSAIFRLIEARRNEIRSQLPLLEAKSSGCPPRSAGTRCFAFIKAHLCRRCLSQRPRSPVHAGAGGPQPGDQRQNFLEHLPRHRDLGHLECDVAAVAHDLGADLNQLLAQAGQRPRLRRLRNRQRPHEIAEIVGQGMKLKANRVGGEGSA